MFGGNKREKGYKKFVRVNTISPEIVQSSKAWR